MSRKKQIAYHEAAHAVIGRVLTLPCGRATIRRDHDSAGHSICADPYFCIYDWEKRGKVRSLNAVWVARIIAFMAGTEAEVALLGKEPQGDGDDRDQISLMMEKIAPDDWSRYEARLRRMTRMLVRRHEARIERVANRLLTKNSLSAKVLDRLAGRSMGDVRPNALPLAMAGMQESAGN